MVDDVFQPRILSEYSSCDVYALYMWHVVSQFCLLLQNIVSDAGIELILNGIVVCYIVDYFGQRVVGTNAVTSH